MSNTNKSEYGILVDYQWCTGCHACEMACQMEHGYPIGQSGIKVFQMGPWQISGDQFEYDYSVMFGDQCNLCSKRIAKGKKPSCVKHCEAACMEYGRLDELLPKLSNHRKQALFALQLANLIVFRNMCYPCKNCGRCELKKPKVLGICLQCQTPNKAGALVCVACGKPLPPLPGISTTEMKQGVKYVDS